MLFMFALPFHSETCIYLEFLNNHHLNPFLLSLLVSNSNGQLILTCSTSWNAWSLSGLSPSILHSFHIMYTAIEYQLTMHLFIMSLDTSSFWGTSIFYFFKAVSVLNILMFMLYYSYCLHSSWHKYTTHFPSLHVSALWGHLQIHWGLQSPVSLSATPPTLASVCTLGVRCMYGLCMHTREGKCVVYLCHELCRW
jgi:hypothetical protein